MHLNDSLRSGIVNSGYDFDSVESICRMYGKTCKRIPFRSAFKVPGKENTLAWLVSEQGGDGWTNELELGPKSDDRGFKEVIAIREFNENDDKTQANIERELAWPKTRYVFTREERLGVSWYKARGTFMIDRTATLATRTTLCPCVVYTRTSTTFECLKAKNVARVYSDEEFAMLKGKTVEVNLLDDIPFVADCGKSVEGEAKAWPGAKFVVRGFVNGLSIVKCETDDRILSEGGGVNIDMGKRVELKSVSAFYIPRRDFELGYVGVLQDGASVEASCDDVEPVDEHDVLGADSQPEA